MAKALRRQAATRRRHWLNSLASMLSKNLKIGFFSCQNYYDRMSFSGILWCMFRALDEHAEIVPLGSPYQPTRLRDMVRGWEDRRLQKISNNGHPNAYWKKFRSEVEKQLQKEKVDLIFAPVASAELSKVDFEQPVVYASDATFQLIHARYGQKFTAEKAAELDKAERHAIETAAGIAYSSNWAADSAVRDYGASHEKIRVIPFGANLMNVMDAVHTREKIGKLPWKIVFLGMYWHRKGGDIAVEALKLLRSRGIQAELTIVGTTPSEEIDLPGVRVFPFIDKRKAHGRQQFRDILVNSHFMIFPSRADCSPVALCEAAAYGVPVVASDVGGIRTIVTKRNGILVPAGSPAELYADTMMELMGDEGRYRELVHSSRERYEEVLNWDKWSHSLLAFCEQLV